MTSDDFRVLLIDDDEDEYINLRDLFGEITRSSYFITWKSSYDSGLKALREEKFDVCLLDYGLGERTGLDLLSEARKHEIVCPVIFLTGQGDFELDIQAMQIGAADYLVKGQLTAPLLERSVRYAMKHAMDMRELEESKALILQQDRLASIGLLASSLAHEIGTPLGIIRSRAELAERKASSDPALKENMGIVINQIDRIAKLVNSLLHLARGKESDLAAVVNLNAVFQDVLNLMQHEFERKGISLKTKIPPDISVRAEPGPLGQVLLNLLVNAVHAIEDAKLRGRNGEHEVRLSVEELKEKVKILVEDSGFGVRDEHRSQLFKPFFTTKDIGAGTGLGLATSFKIIQSWGGTIVSRNTTYGSGAVFEIDLPRIN